MKKLKLVALAAVFVFSFMVYSLPTSSHNGDTWISETAQKSCEKYGKKYGICPELLEAIIETESSGNPNVANGSCIGLMQVSYKWHASRMSKLGAYNLYDENQNIHVGTDYLAELFEKYGEASLVLDIYNGNSKAQYNYENGIISNYASKILTRSSDL